MAAGFSLIMLLNYRFNEAWPGAESNLVARIAFIAYDWSGYHGGPIVNARRLLPELQRRGHEVHALIFYHRGDAPSARYLQAQGVTVHSHAWQAFTEQHIAWILEKLVEIQPDIFVPNVSVAGWFAARWAREAGIPSIATHRSDDAFYWAMVEQFVSGESPWAVSGLVCVSDYLSEQTKARHPKQTALCTIPSGVPDCQQLADQHSDGLRLAYVGRFVQQQKRIFDLVDALIATARQIPNLSADLYGEALGTERARIEQTIEQAGLSTRIRCSGAVDPEQLHQQLLQHQVLVLLSDYEGTPGAVMDGMACGLVPVCLDIPGGVQELVRHEQTGLLVKDRGADFVSAIKRLEADPALREQLGKNAREHIRSNFSLAVAADRWETFCAELLATAGEKSPITIPTDYALPAVRKALAGEDRRGSRFSQRVFDRLRRMAVYLYHRLLKS